MVHLHKNYTLRFSGVSRDIRAREGVGIILCSDLAGSYPLGTNKLKNFKAGHAIDSEESFIDRSTYTEECDGKRDVL